jgi:hypothetical protein
MGRRAPAQKAVTRRPQKHQNQQHDQDSTKHFSSPCLNFLSPRIKSGHSLFLGCQCPVYASAVFSCLNLAKTRPRSSRLASQRRKQKNRRGGRPEGVRPRRLTLQRASRQSRTALHLVVRRQRINSWWSRVQTRVPHLMGNYTVRNRQRKRVAFGIRKDSRSSTRHANSGMREAGRPMATTSRQSDEVRSHPNCFASPCARRWGIHTAARNRHERACKIRRFKLPTGQ